MPDQPGCLHGGLVQIELQALLPENLAEAKAEAGTRKAAKFFLNLASIKI